MTIMWHSLMKEFLFIAGLFALMFVAVVGNSGEVTLRAKPARILHLEQPRLVTVPWNVKV